MPAASEPLPALEQRLTERLLAFECLDEACPAAAPRSSGDRPAARAARDRHPSGVHRHRPSRETRPDAAVQLRRWAADLAKLSSRAVEQRVAD